MRKLLGLLFILALIPLSIQAANIDISIPVEGKQGDTLIGKFALATPRITQATFDGADISFFSYGTGQRVLVPIHGAKAPGSYVLRIVFDNGEILAKTIKVQKGSFVLVDLGIPKELDLTPQKLITKLQDEKKSIDAVTKPSSTPALFTKTFGLPLYDNRKIGSPYGEIRRTGDSVIRHWGVDFGAKEGASVAAINAGVVKSAYYDTVYGNTIIVDHGGSIFSLYMHLQSMKAKVGDVVTRGQVIGAVGKTGYSTAPHLHLSLKIGGISVNPLRFVATFR